MELNHYMEPFSCQMFLVFSSGLHPTFQAPVASYRGHNGPEDLSHWSAAMFPDRYKEERPSKAASILVCP